MRKDSYTHKIKIVKYKDLFPNRMEPRIRSLKLQLKYLIASGYNIYDVTKEAGFANLNTATVGKWVCVWSGTPAASYSLTLTHITRHTDVIIVNAIINTIGDVTDIATNTFTIPDGDYTNKLCLTGGYYYIYAAAAVKGIRLDGGLFMAFGTAYVNQANIGLENAYIQHTHIKTTKNITLTHSTAPTAGAPYINNAIIEETSGGVTIDIVNSSTSSNDHFNGLTVKFCTSTAQLKLRAAAQKVMNFTALKLINLLFNFNLNIQLIYSDNGSKIFYESLGLTVSGASSAKTWQALPSAGSTSNNADYIDTGYDENGVLYRAYQDKATSDKLTVDKYVGGAWVNVGGAGISAAAATHISMHIVSSTHIVVVYSDANATGKASAKKWNGSSWAAYGTGFTAGAATNLIYKSGALIFRDGANSNKITVMFTADGSSWSLIGTAGISASAAIPVYLGSYSPLSYNWLAVYLLDTGDLRYDYNMYGSWSTSHTLIKSGISKCKALKFTYENLDLVYILTASNKVSSFRWNPQSGIVQYGSEDFSNAAADYCDIALDGSVPWVAFKDTDTANKATVMKFDGVSAWSYPTAAGISAGQADFINLIIRNSVPVVSYKDGGTSSKFTALKYDDPAVSIVQNYDIDYSEDDYFRGEYCLDEDILEDTADIIEQDFLLRPENEPDFIKTPIIKNFHAMEPDASAPFDDDLKQLGSEEVVINQLDEYETDLIGKTINNLKIYDGLTEYNFNKNDNFIITAVSDKNTAKFIYWNKKLKQSIYSDVYKNTVYTITSARQIWLEKSTQNFIDTYADLDDSPVTGEALHFNNLDNEVIVG